MAGAPRRRAVPCRSRRRAAVARSFGPVDGEAIRPGGKLTLCTYANALGLPAVSVPVMVGDAGLPVGVQLIGARGHERALLALARELERALGGWLDPDASRACSDT